MNDLADKIAALLAKAETTTPAEAEAIMEKVDELMAKYSLSQAMLDAARLARGDKVKGFTEVTLKAEGSYQHALMNLICDVAKGLGCRAHYSNLGNHLIVTLAGRQDEVEHAQVLIASVQIQAARAMKAERSAYVKQYPTSSPKARYQHCRSFLMGYGSGVKAKLEAAREKLLHEQAAPVRDTLKNAIQVYRTELDNWYEQKHPRMRTTRFSAGSGYSEGKEAGAKADVGGAKIPGSAAKELSS